MVFVDHVVPAMKYHSKNIIADRSRLMTEVQSNADSNRNTDNEITYDISKRAVVTALDDRFTEVRRKTNPNLCKSCQKAAKDRKV